MIIWLASYPRSGNTLLRQMLNLCFAEPSYSIYNDVADIASNPEVREAVGHREYEGEWKDFLAHATASPDRFFIKTHEAPLDSAKAIFIARHPYRAISSFRGYLGKIAGLDVGMERAICGDDLPFPSWGAHLDTWNPLARPDTLLLKYEDIVRDPEVVVRALESFLGKVRLRDWVNPFDRLQGIMPEFFVQGSTDSNGLDPSHACLIDLLYGGWMESLHYAPHDSPPDDSRIRQMLAEAIHRFQREVGANREKLAKGGELTRVLKQWAEKAEERCVVQRDLALEYKSRAEAAEAALAAIRLDGSGACGQDSD